MNFSYQFGLIKRRCIESRNTKDKHRKIHELDFDKEYLEEIWNQQKGICPVTGMKLILKTHKTKKDKLKINHASVDRIDPNKGYIKGNIRFISIMVNFALNSNFNDEDFLELVRNTYKYVDAR